MIINKNIVFFLSTKSNIYSKNISLDLILEYFFIDYHPLNLFKLSHSIRGFRLKHWQNKKAHIIGLLYI